MDSVRQPGIGHGQGLDELADLDPNNLDWSQSEDDEHPAIVSTSQFLDTLVTLPELIALEPDASDSPVSPSTTSSEDSDLDSDSDLDADAKPSPEQLIGVVCKIIIPISRMIMRVYPALMMGASSRYISYLRALVTLITGSSGVLSLIRQLYTIRTEPSISKSASSLTEIHRKVKLLYFDLLHIYRITLFEFQLLCDIEFPTKSIKRSLEHRLQLGTLGGFELFFGDHIFDVYHGCERIKARDRGRQENEISQLMCPSLYSPLIVNYGKQEIRLLELLPGQITDDIHCRLVIADLKTSSHFQALSYVWGTGTASESVHIDGHPFPVTRILQGILRGLRHPVDCRRIWVDAICINQQDNFEKSAQVDLMGSIYESAEVVAIWLSGDRIDGMTTSITQCQDTVGYNEHDLASLTNIMESMLAQNDISTELWWNTIYHFSCCLHSVLIDEWWERVWTVQEACLSSKPPIILFRGYTFSWDILEHAVKLNRELTDIVINQVSHSSRDQFPNPQFMEPMIQALINIPITHRGTTNVKLAFQWRANPPSSNPSQETPVVTTTPRNSLAYLIYHSTWQRSTDPRDKIFALRGLLPKHLRLLLYSDYNEEFYETFHRATGYALCELNGMNLYSGFDTLHATNPSQQEVLDWVPSWVLDPLSNQSPPWNKLENQIGEEKTFSNYLSDGDLGFYPHPRDQLSGMATLSTLVCLGGRIGKVKASGKFPDVGPTLKNGKIANSINQILEQHKENLIRTVCALDSRTGPLWRMREKYSIHQAIFLGAEEYESSFQRGRPEWLDKTFLPRVRQLSQKYYFVTEDGYIGMGIAPFQDGDELFVLSECRVPWVLRKFSDTRYKMVCRAWVGGMMERELEPLFGNGKFPSKLIRIV
ncbi:heterokaryon incompatibility protein-domain-containing protein [Xylaria arbuscula]|nr:heterokaryon incompatibility protein-domain-containing protein [Xylaria arbuscula]